ncbi:MAG: glycosyltransferase [Ruminococcus sp.]|nr:glycosyltransferase [Ruminococcus sp.]MBR6646912.1 glycosyltransferase [Clostridia bacterium]
MPAVSIIVPVYNAENYLHKCIASILNQNFSDFELILVNDGSKDNSGNICDKYARSDNRIKVVHKENGGVSSARNRGLDEACGKYIMFCDSDDYVSELYCSSLVNLADNDEESLIIAGITLLDDSDTPTEILCDAYPTGKSASLSNQEFCDLFVKLNFDGSFQLMHMPVNKLYSRKIIELNKLRFDTSICYNEDIIFNLQYLDKTKSVRIFNESIYYYYTATPDSACKKYIENLIDIYQIKEDMMKKVITDKATNTQQAHAVWSTFVFNDTNRAINNTLSPSNPAPKKEKIKYCNKLIRDKRFQASIKHANKTGYNKFYVFLLRFKSYRLIHLLQKLF